MFLIQDSCTEMVPFEPAAIEVGAAEPAAPDPLAAAAALTVDEVAVVVPDEQAARPTPATPRPAMRRKDLRLASRLAICRADCGSTWVMGRSCGSSIDACVIFVLSESDPFACHPPCAITARIAVRGRTHQPRSRRTA